jgi:hypothetical protein
VGYLDLRKIDINGAAQLAIQKIESKRQRITRDSAKPSVSASSQITGKLRLKKKFTDQDRDTFLDEAFEVIARFFQDTMAKLEEGTRDTPGSSRESPHFPRGGGIVLGDFDSATATLVMHRDQRWQNGD